MTYEGRRVRQKSTTATADGPPWIRRSPEVPSHVAPLPGYLCEWCQEAPAVQWQPVPEGGEMGG